MVSVWSQEARKCTRVLKWRKVWAGRLPREVPALRVGVRGCCVVVGGLVRRNSKCKDSEAGGCLTSVTGRKKSPWLQHIVGRD